MLHVEIKIQSLEDKDKPAFPELKKFEEKGKLKYAEVSKVLVMEKATNTGNTGLHIAGITANGEAIVLQTSALILEGINAAVTGAVKKFGG